MIFEKYYLGLAYFSQIFWVGYGLSIATVGLAYYRFGFSKLTLFLITVISLVTGAVFFLGPPQYIYMYVFVVGYHFMTWLLFYIVEMRKRGQVQLRTFILQNILVIAPFLIGGYLFLASGQQTAAWLFDYQLYITATYIHISTSFLNDEWLITLQEKFFGLFGR